VFDWMPGPAHDRARLPQELTDSLLHRSVLITLTHAVLPLYYTYRCNKVNSEHDDADPVFLPWRMLDGRTCGA
jgi:hypothetical protein